jgi:hypothetical protein
MTTFVSRRHPYKFYCSIILGALFLIALGLIMATMPYRYRHSNTGSLKYTLLPMVAVICWGLAILIVVRYIRKTPLVTITASELTIGKQMIEWSAIETLQLSGKRNFPLIIGHPMEATTIVLKNGGEIILFDELYANAAEMKQWLAHYILHQPVSQNNYTEDPREVDENYAETFKGHPLFSFRGLAMWGFIGFFAYLTLTDSKFQANGALVAGFACLGWFIAMSYQMNYFIVTPTHLIVKNHYFFWKKKTYRISDIEELVFETKPKMPNYLRVITKNFENKLFPAGTLLDKHWLALGATMHAQGIKVRNECI